MARKIKKTRKQLLKEPDEFITFTGQLIQFSKQHQKEIIIAVGLFIISVITYSAIRYTSHRNEERAFFLLDQAMARYASVAKQDSGKAYGEVQSDFAILLDKYSGKTGGKLAKIKFADICYKAGQTDQAISLYSDALKTFKHNSSLNNLILSGLGYTYLKKGELDKAIGYFKQIAENPDNLMKDDALFLLGCLYGESGKMEPSQGAFKRIIDEFPDSVHNRLVKEKV